jgi:hypothetical protein
LLLIGRKMPDDLSVAEFNQIVSAADMLCRSASWATLLTVNPALKTDVTPVLISVRYGSPLEFIVGIPAVIIGTLAGLAKAVKLVAESAEKFASTNKLVAEAGLVDAQTRKTDAETELLRMEIDARRRALSDPRMQERAAQITANQLREAGHWTAAQRVESPLHEPYPAATAQDVMETFYLRRAVQDLATFRPNIDVESA